MPPRKIKIQSQSKKDTTIKTITVEKLDDMQKTNVPDNTIIKTNIPINEPIIKDSKKNYEEDDIIENEETNEVIKDNDEVIENEDKSDKENEDKSDEENEDKSDKENENKSDEENEDNTDNIEPEPDAEIIEDKIIESKNNKISKIEQVKNTYKTKQVKNNEKIHNHSKPKTIIASTKIVNTVDMFGDDDLDFRYIMMNYDYTKNLTMPKITKYERALLIGKRAKQIEEGANPNVKYISGQSVISIAEEELRQRKIPLIIKRPIGNKFEYWKPADMEVNMD
jgi:DNA-directed RNA polymerase subunit K/omega